ncbi:MAG: BON domain-containing protein [Proteobacteria bacterium]|nr:BON domain-containing protein [Pseudomonadota bacterium]MBU1685808.1 BON domain-containing protein [Pseudomonadota bacterium]
MKILSRVALQVFAVALLVTAVPVAASATDMDARIESSARDSYVFRKYLKDDAITLESTDGIVVLTGTVAEVDHKSLAQETVASLPGVKSVVNQLELAGEPVAENSDEWITTKVKATLLFHRNVSAKTEVTTKDGIVVLEGEANSQAQKELTTEHVKDVEGVKGVENKMTVAKSAGTAEQKTLSEKVETVGNKVGDKIENVVEAIDDASITALVKTTLVFHRSTSAHHTKVTTNDGRVTLTGTARTSVEKDLVAKYVEDVQGVKSVVNNITVGKPITVKKPKVKKQIEGC